MADFALAARPRTTLGKKVKQLRNAGITPANIYGHNVPSVSIEADTHDLALMLRRAGRTHLIQVTVEGERAPRPVLVRSYTRRPTTDQLLHVDFFQVSMREKLQVDVPLVLVGTAPVLDTVDATVVQQLATVSVECLPSAIPASIDVDLSPLVDTSMSIFVRDLQVPEGVTILTDGDVNVVSVTARTAAAEAEAEAVEEAEAAAEVAEAAAEEAAEAEEKASEG
jgi:large subunit ribosomal protein L25